MWRVRQEAEGDGAGVEALVDLCFGKGRYAKTAYRLREGVKEEGRLSFIAEAEADGKLLGSVRFWPIVVGKAPSLLLGPLAVQPSLRGQGIGIGLMKRGIEEAKALGYETIILVGDEPYYARVGFSRIGRGRVSFPGPVNPERILGLELKKGELEKLNGLVKRARLDEPVTAPSAPVR